MSDEAAIGKALSALCAEARKRGASVKHRGQGHFQIEGEWLVNYWPLSKRRTAHVAGAEQGIPHRTPAEAVAMAYASNVRTIEIAKPAVAQKAGKGFKRLSAKFRAQGGLCSLCAGPMVLVNFVALKPAARRVAFDNPLVATIDHDVPRFHGRAIEHNLRAAHKACNELKGHELIEPYPLACYEPRPLLIKLPDGQFVQMEAV